MRASFYSHIVFFIISNILTASCQEKRSLGFVIDCTMSMRVHMSEVKEIAAKLVDSYDTPSDHIQNMLLVTFGESNAGLVILTEDRHNFKAHINNITALHQYGHWDSAEPSMQGILVALENSLPGSYIFLFTDASSKDYWQSSAVISSCQTKGIQGDSLSSLWFCLALNPLSTILEAFGLGYRLRRGGRGLSHLLFMDDMKLLAPNELQLMELLKIFFIYIGPCHASSSRRLSYDERSALQQYRLLARACSGYLYCREPSNQHVGEGTSSKP